jgi:class 3 adenylate cyclase/tetratricopeptide (TPR) repeat protein
MKVCPSCGQENPDVAKFCLACGSALAEPEPAVEERKLITVLFTDIVGSTAKAENMDPEDVRARLAPYYGRLRRELEHYGGTVEKFIGDAVVALFGAPVAREDDPERAVRAAFAVCNAIEALNDEDEWLDLQVRVGVNTGEALVVLGARASEGEGMASGDVMNTAARLQSAAPINGILVGELTHAATRQVIEYRDAEPIAAKGKSEPVLVWEAVAIREQPGLRPAGDGALVGRDEELATLLELWRRVCGEQAPAQATVLGPPGIGKSRLLAELTRAAAESGAVHTGRCLPYGEGITYWPITDILKSAAGILQSDGPEAMSAKLGALLDGLPTDDADELRTMAAAVSNLVGVPTTPRGTYLATDISQAELHWGFRRVLQLLALRRPLLLVVEDLHWAEQTLLELLQYVQTGEEVPLLVVGSARPELADIRPGFAVESERRHTILLEPLVESAGEELLAQLLGSAELARDPAAAALLRNAGGNPLFVEETVRMLSDSGLVDEGGWRTGGGAEGIAVPTSLQALIASRLDLLALPEKQVAQHASVVGAVFWPGAIAHLQNGGGNGELGERLQTLERRDVVREHDVSSVAGELEYGFKHMLIRDVAYGQLPKGRRAELHLRFSEWVGAVPGSEDEFVEIVAYHLEQSCRLAREVARSPVPPPVDAAVEALTHAAEKAQRREGIREADRFYARALELVTDAPPEKTLALRLRHARTRTALGEHRQAHESLLEVAEQAQELGRRDIRCGALIGLAHIDQKHGRLTEARRLLKEAQSIATEIGDRLHQVRAGYELGTLSGDFEGELEEALANLRRSLVLAEELDDRFLRTEGHLRMGATLINAGEFAQAEEQFVRCIGLAEELGSHRDQARATCLLGQVRYYRVGVEDAERLAVQARDWLDRTSESYYQIQNLRQLALYALARGDPVRAEEWLREALPPALEMGGWLLLDVYRYLVEALVRQERLDDARQLAEFAGRHVSEEDFYDRVAVRLAEASIAAADRDFAAVTDCFGDVFRLLEQESSPILIAEARVDLARALARLGEDAAAVVELEQAKQTFGSIGAGGLVAELDREFAELRGGAAVSGPTSSV